MATYTASGRTSRDVRSVMDHLENLGIEIASLELEAGELLLVTPAPIPAEQLEHLELQELP